MMMKKVLKYSLFFLMIAAVLAVFGITAAAAPAKPDTHTDGGACKSHPGTLVTLSDIADTAAARNSGVMRAPDLDPVTADLPLAVIVIGFSDQAYRSDIDWAQRIFRAEDSLAAYYSDMSFGRFTFTPVNETSAYGKGNTNRADAVNDGVIHVTLNVPHDDWRQIYAFKSQRDTETMLSLAEALIAALEAADACVDFSAYDVNGDGAITTNEMGLAFIVAGYEAASSIGYEHGTNLYLWSHAYSLQEAKRAYGFSYALPAPDGVTLNDYIAISEQEDDGSPESVGVLAHELGHYLGLPDLYDTANNYGKEWGKYSVEYLSLMNYGCYGVDPDTGKMVPYSLDIWSRVILGWVEPIRAEANDTGDYTLTAQNYRNDANYTALRVSTGNPNEYYLLENRSFAKWDAGLAKEFSREKGGIILWHIDDAVWDAYSDSNAVNNTDHRPCVMPLYGESAGGKATFIGKNTSVDLHAAFFDRTVWKTKYASLGDALDLPVYGTGRKADLRSGRTLSGIKLQFLSVAAEKMQVRLNPPHVHTIVYKVVKAPTCTEEGEAYYYCKECGCYFADENGDTQITEPFAVDALGHDYIDHEAQAPTCTEIGWEAYQTCSRCEYTEYAELPALGHDYIDHEAQSPTCTDIGWEAYRTCSRCEYTEYAELPALGHDYIDHEAQTPTCTRIGWEAYRTCSRCEYTEYAELPALGHDYIEHEAQTPTCTELGWEAYRTCSRCEYTDYAELPALGHDYIDHEAQTPTCTEIGWEAYRTCSRCEYTDYAELPALGHLEKTVPGVPATCTSGGTTDSVVCERCGETLTAAVQIPAPGHSWGEWTELNETLHQRVCANDPLHAETEAHTWNEGEVTKPVTAFENGELTLTCLVCGAVRTEIIEKPAVTSANIGDIDGDEKLTAADARLALRAAVGLENYEGLIADIADADRSGTITASDARLILRAAVGLEDRKDWIDP